jgi:hypothetical protein
LVFAVANGVNTTHAEQIRDLAQANGVDSFDLLAPLGDFLLAGQLTRQIATLRVRYRPPERVLGRLDDLERQELVRADGTGLTATDTLRPVLHAILDAEAAVAADLWGDHEQHVAIASAGARAVAAAASEDHEVAAVHRALPEPADPYHVLYHRLVTLRYIRQHDHVEAWRAHDLTAPEMVVVTTLWQGSTVEPSDTTLKALVARGFAADDAPALTTHGQQVRDAIEDETNRRAQLSFDALEAGAAFLGALRALPGSP